MPSPLHCGHPPILGDSDPQHADSNQGPTSPYRVDYNAVLDFQYAPDVAALFVAASRSHPDKVRDAPVLNPRGHVVSVEQFLDRVKAITGYSDLAFGDQHLPLLHAASPQGLSDLLGDATTTSLDKAIAATAHVLANNAPQPRQHP